MIILLIVLLLLLFGGYGYGRPRLGWGWPVDLISLLAFVILVVFLVRAVGGL